MIFPSAQEFNATSTAPHEATVSSDNLSRNIKWKIAEDQVPIVGKDNQLDDVDAEFNVASLHEMSPANARVWTQRPRERHR